MILTLFTLKVRLNVAPVPIAPMIGGAAEVVIVVITATGPGSAV